MQPRVCGRAPFAGRSEQNAAAASGTATVASRSPPAALVARRGQLEARGGVCASNVAACGMRAAAGCAVATAPWRRVGGPCGIAGVAVESASAMRPAAALRRGVMVAAAAAADLQAQASAEGEGGRDFAVAMATELSMTKCQDIIVLHVAPLVSWTSFMVFCSVKSKPQLTAACTRLAKLAKADFDREPLNNAGSSPWECLDFGDVVVHVMSEEQREFYDVESFYATADEVELPFEQEEAMPPPTAPRWTRDGPAEL